MSSVAAVLLAIVFIAAMAYIAIVAFTADREPTEEEKATKVKDAIVLALLAADEFWGDQPLANGSTGRIIAAEANGYVVVIGDFKAADDLRELVETHGCYVERAQGATDGIQRC